MKTYSMKMVGRIEVANMHTVHLMELVTCCHWYGLVFVLPGRLVTYMKIAYVLSFSEAPLKFL